MATATRKSTAKRARKTSRAKTGSARTGSTARKAASARDDEETPAMLASLGGLGRTLEQLNLSSMASTIAEGRRKDLSALVAANRKSYEGLQAVVAHQTAMLKSALGDWQALAQDVSTRGGAPAFGQMDEVARQTFTLALQNIRELGELAARSQAEAFEIVRRRTMENVEEVSALMKRGR